MKIVFNSYYENAACTVFYRDALSRLPEVTINDFDNYSLYDVALFMTYPNDLEELKRVKLDYPEIKTAIIDPRNEAVLPFTEFADFLILDSLEMRDYWTRAYIPLFEYVEYPDLKMVSKTHVVKDKIIIGYHGNVVHLNCMSENISPALDKLSEKYDIEFHAIYNIKNQGKWDYGLPRKTKIKHIQWHKNVYYDEMSVMDIGIVPAFMPAVDTIKHKQTIIEKLFSRKKNPIFNFTKEDYLHRYKMPTNPGRIIVFGLMGIPVVSDFFPSAMRVIEDENNGLLAASESGWYCALEKLIKDYEKRQNYSEKMQYLLKNKYDFDVQNIKFKEFINTEILGKKI